RPAGPAPAIHQRVVQGGIAVDFTIEILGPSGRAARPLREGDDVAVRFAIADTATGAPLKDLYPKAWLAARGSAAAPEATSCRSKVQALLNSSLLAPAELDLNAYQVLILNPDATLTVVDPHAGFGGSQLLALVPLAAPG